MARKPQILSVDCSPDLVSSRDALLRNSGHDVMPADSVAEGERYLSERSFDLVLLCHTVPRDERLDLAKHIRNSYPGTLILAMFHQFVDPTFPADAVIASLSGPQALLDCISDLLERGKPREVPVDCTPDTAI